MRHFAFTNVHSVRRTKTERRVVAALVFSGIRGTEIIYIYERVVYTVALRLCRSRVESGVRRYLYDDAGA